MQAKISKFIAAVLALVIIFANSWSVVSYAAEVFLSEKELENQNTTSKDGSVDFDVQYTNGKHSATLNIDEKNTKLNIAVSLKKSGYVKDLVIDFSSSNFEIAQINDENTNENGNATQTTVVKKIQNFDAENKKITFGQITNKEQISEQIYINPIIKEEIDEDNFSKDNKIKLTCTFVDTDAKETKVEKEIVLHTEWTAKNVETELNYETIKYIPYASNEGNKIIVQGKAILNVKNYLLPIKDSKIAINVPKIADEYPEEVWIEKNPDETTVDTSNMLHPVTFDYDFEYDKNTGKLEIEKKYEAKDEKIKWWRIPLEYTITYVYSSNAYENVKDKTVKLKYDVNSETTFYGNEDLIVKNKSSVETEQKEKIGEIAELVAENVENVNKGYMYNNTKATSEENKKETEFTYKYALNITYANLIDSFTVTQSGENFITSQDNKYKANSYIKSLKISRQEFETLFGKEGKIEIKSEQGTLLTIINKDTQDEQGIINVDLTPLNIESFVIETSKPQKEGNLNFEITKAITKESSYSLEQMKKFEKMQSTISLVAKSGDINVINETLENEIKLEEPTPKVSLIVSNDRWSTVTTNENVKLSVTLENDTIDDVLYTNPKFKVILPKYIENIEIETVQTLFNDELKVSSVIVYDNEDGTKTIEAQLEGTQTLYNNPTAKGATVIFATDITLNKLTPTTDTKIEVVVENGDENKTTAKNEIAIKYVAPTGVVTTNSVTGYNGNEKLEVVNGEAKQELIAAKSVEKVLTFEMNVINNYENTLDDVVVLGRTMFKGNKSVDTLADLGSTMNIPLASEITASGIPEEKIKIYYSTNENATKDLESVNNNWTTSVTDYSSIKSYMIVLDNYTMQCGDILKFSYKAKAPADLDYNNSAYEMYGVYFRNNKDTGTIEDKSIATKIGLTTGKEAVIDAKLESKIGEGGSVKAGEELSYVITVNNNGSINAENTTINIEIPSNLEYAAKDGEDYKVRTIMPLVDYSNMKEPDWDSIDWSNSPMSKDEMMEAWKKQMEALKQQQEEYNKWVEEQKAQGVEFDPNITEEKKILVITVGNLNKYQTITKNVTFKASHIGTTAEDETVKVKATVKYNEDMEFDTNEVTNIIKVDYFNASISSNNEGPIKVGDTYECTINVSTNDIENSTTNTILKITLPAEMEYKSVTFDDGKVPNNVNVKGNILEINIGEVSGSNTKQLILQLTVKDLESGIYKKKFFITGTIQADGKNAEDISGLEDTINKIGLSIIQSCNIPANTTISAAEQFTYTFTVTNLSDIAIDDITFTDKLPEEVQFKNIEIVYADGSKKRQVTVNADGEIQTTFDLGESSYVNINVDVTAKSLPKDKTITNKGKVSQSGIEDVESNSITHIIELFDKDNMDPDKPSYTKKITGTVWIDKNRDGIKNGEESKVANVKVLLLDQNGNIAKNSKGEDCIVLTDADGDYLFNNLNEGVYTVVFLYDSSLYSATTYRKDGVDESMNSDAVDKTVVYEGVQRIAAITESIRISTSNVYNIDLGLIDNAKFDLKLDKTVKVITTNNGKKVEEHTYNNKLAKIDFEAKYINQSSMVVEYTLTVTNEGGVEGYAKKIADYIPTELKFNSELNKDWYEGPNGTVYNSSLANTIIKPGESKTVTLILTKNMNSEDFGVFSNNAEIYEASNNYGLVDIDSTPGNKASNEDDYSIANVVVGVKTGQTVVYVLLTAIVLAILGFGVYMIKKKILK